MTLSYHATVCPDREQPITIYRRVYRATIILFVTGVRIPKAAYRWVAIERKLSGLRRSSMTPCVSTKGSLPICAEHRSDRLSDWLLPKQLSHCMCCREYRDGPMGRGDTLRNDQGDCTSYMRADIEFAYIVPQFASRRVFVITLQPLRDNGRGERI